MLLNCLRLTMTLITQKKQEQSQIGRTLAEDGDHRIIRRLIELVQEGPAINFCSFSQQVYFMLISILRAFILHSQQTKKLIMNDKLAHGSHNSATIVDCLLSKLEPANIEQVNDELEGAILSLFTQLVKEEQEFKK